MNEALASSSDGNMSDDYDFVSSPDSTPPSSPRVATVLPRSSKPSLMGWSTLNLSEDLSGADGPKSATAQRGFSSATSATCKKNRIETTPPSESTTKPQGPFSCKACHSLLRDCVECPSCHSLFCREHLRLDEATGTSPCPCEPCCGLHAADGNNNNNSSSAEVAAAAGVQLHHPRDAFLSNIPVQRMADAVASRCDACGASFSWGELGEHLCDLQVVACKHARWGCHWTGQRHETEDHLTSSTCPGQLAKAEQDVVEARAEVAAVRAELAAAREATKVAERRATSAEMRGQELEAKIATVETSLLQSKKAAAEAAAAAAAADAAASKKAEQEAVVAALVPPHLPLGAIKPSSLMRVSKIIHSATGSRAGGGGGAPSARRTITIGKQQQQPSATLSSSAASAETQHMTKAGLMPASVPSAGKAAMATTASPPPPHLSTVAREMTPATTTRQAARPPVMRPVVAEAASQVPVPATEACLKPFLERPRSLLEKKVVVFWPRQGRWYVGRPTVYKELTKEHRVEYDDGDVRDHVLAQRSWGLIG